MAGAATNRFGGGALIGGGVLFAFAIAAHPAFATLAEASAANMARWSVVHWAYLVGDTFLVGGLVTLFRYLAMRGDGSNEGPAALALAFGTLAFTLDAASSGIHLFAFPPAITANAAGLQAIYDATGAANAGIGGASSSLACLGLIALGVALKRGGWSAGLASGVIVIGALEFLLAVIPTFTGSPIGPTGLVGNLIGLPMPLAYVAVGAAFRNASA
jgi:hypothetical protein